MGAPAGGAADDLWAIVLAVAGFLAVTVIGWIKLELAGLRKDHDDLDARVDAAEKNIEARAAFCSATSNTVGKFMERIESKLDRLVEHRHNGKNEGQGTS